MKGWDKMVKNEVYEQEIERIGPKLEKLKDLPFDEIMRSLHNAVFCSDITISLVFALTYILDPSRFFIEVEQGRRNYAVKFTADTPLRGLGDFVYRNTLSAKRPTDKEARDFTKKFLAERIEVEGLLEKAEEVVDTCKVIQGP